MVNLINKGQTITLEVANPNYGVMKTKQDIQKESLQNWIQLDQLKTHPEFRREFDKLLNINIVTENGVNGKSGCIYVDSEGDRNGNTTLADALKNSVFVEQYLLHTENNLKIKELAPKAYTDIKNTKDVSALIASINAYYNLLDEPGATEFKGNQLITREDFYTLVFKAETPVQKLESDKLFELAIGGKTDKSIYAQSVADYGWLQTTTKSLDAKSYKGTMSRAEAVYLVVNKYLPDLFKEVTIFDKGYKDTKNAGDLVKKLGLKENGVPKEKWQFYTLAYMLKHPDEGLQEEMYKAMVISKSLDLMRGDESRWDEAITKEEAIRLVIDTHLAVNDIQGYKTTIEYGKMNESKFDVAYSEDKVLGYTEDGYAYGENWVELPKGTTGIIDPYQTLDNGMKLVEVKQMLKEYEAKWKKENKSLHEIDALKSEIAKGLGTDIATLNAIPDSEIAKFVQKEKEEKEILAEAKKVADTSKIKQSTNNKKTPPKTVKKGTTNTNTKKSNVTASKNSPYSNIKLPYGARVITSKEEFDDYVAKDKVNFSNHGKIPVLYKGVVYMCTHSDIKALNMRTDRAGFEWYLNDQIVIGGLDPDYIRGSLQDHK
ncbi:hypothetical protein Q428_01560 [Fervidicella metallireducens AeB]|uniref:SLH domain-containing protein n=1 Tax=Fervidicella metallireducens AeB TaxID=1403537 RepID=A0A017RYX2_9CLOT|nr:hypothetical protein [Fervidicella metallireducens]EYE89579.1 hypothetical protein Q428_01560 [Fervidicella metallireducens AeB]